MSTSVASVVSHFPSAENGFTTTLSGTISSGATTVGLNSVSGYSNGEVAVFVVDPTDASKKQTFTGVIDTSGVQVTSVVWTAGTNQTHTAGSTVVDYATATHISMVSKGLLVEHKQTGAHSDVTADSIEVEDLTVTGDLTIAGNESAAGWAPIGGTLSVATGYNKTNKSYEIDSSSDLTSTLSPGMRFKVGTSGVTLPTQSTDLEASSSQYWSKTSPSGLSFTDDFTCEAWIKVESYGARQGILARRNADTEGWSFQLDTSGRVELLGLRIAANNRYVSSYQSVPLNRWVHVAATLDLSGNTGTVYIDGVSVPVFMTTNGTATALVQGTTALVLGAEKSAGTNPADMKICDGRVWSAIRTATEIQDNMCKVLTGSESNLVAYFPMNGNGDDSTSNANNLTAQNSATATTADNPYNQNSGTNYGIITKVTSTKLTVFTGTDSVITNATLASPEYSTQRSPFGFPAGRDKWYVETLNKDDYVVASGNVWAEAASQRISIPIGSWCLSMSALLQVNTGGVNDCAGYLSLSSSSSSEDDNSMTTMIGCQYVASIDGFIYGRANTEKLVNLSAATTYYQIAKENGAIAPVIVGTISLNVIRAECAYL